MQVRTGVEGRSRDLLIPKSHVEPGAAEEGEGINPYQRRPQGRRGGFKSPASEGLSCSPGREDLLPSLRRVVLRSSTGWVGLLLLGVEPGHKSCSHPHERATLFLLNLVTPPVLSPVVKWCVVTILLLARCTSLEFVTDEDYVLESQDSVLNNFPAFMFPKKTKLRFIYLVSQYCHSVS